MGLSTLGEILSFVHCYCVWVHDVLGDKMHAEIKRINLWNQFSSTII